VLSSVRLVWYHKHRRESADGRRFYEKGVGCMGPRLAVVLFQNRDGVEEGGLMWIRLLYFDGKPQALTCISAGSDDWLLDTETAKLFRELEA